MPDRPTDYLLKLDIADIGLLDEAAFKTVMPAINNPNSVYAICFWFYAQRQAGIFKLLSTKRQPRCAKELVEPEAVNSDDNNLTIGGYTDAAGGHFNYRFSGLLDDFRIYLADGLIMVNSRYYQHGQVVGVRAVIIGRFDFDTEGNISFGPARHDASLVDSGVQASLIRYHNVLVFANPDHSDARLRMTVRLSYDEGKTWPVSKLIDPGPSAYSDLVVQADDHIGLLYEQGNHGGIAYVDSLDFPLA